MLQLAKHTKTHCSRLAYYALKAGLKKFAFDILCCEKLVPYKFISLGNGRRDTRENNSLAGDLKTWFSMESELHTQIALETLSAVQCCKFWYLSDTK